MWENYHGFPLSKNSVFCLKIKLGLKVWNQIHFGPVKQKLMHLYESLASLQSLSQTLGALDKEKLIQVELTELVKMENLLWNAKAKKYIDGGR